MSSTCLELISFFSVDATVKADIKRQAFVIFCTISQQAAFRPRCLSVDAFLVVKNSNAFHALKVFPVPVSPFRTITFTKNVEVLLNVDVLFCPKYKDHAHEEWIKFPGFTWLGFPRP